MRNNMLPITVMAPARPVIDTHQPGCIITIAPFTVVVAIILALVIRPDQMRIPVAVMCFTVTIDPIIDTGITGMMLAAM